MKDPSLRRSVTLFRAFLREQQEPERCYTLLAKDAADQVEAYVPVKDRVVVDIGGGGGYFTEEFRRRGAQCHLFEPDLAEMTAAGTKPPEGSVVADGYLLPLADAVADVTFSSNVLEHVDDPQTFLSEMVRVTRPGGLIYVSFTNWLSPWGGHEWAPWHYLGATGPAPAMNDVPEKPRSTRSARTSSHTTSEPPCARCGPATTWPWCRRAHATGRSWPGRSPRSRVCARSRPGTSSSYSGGVHDHGPGPTPGRRKTHDRRP